MRLLKPALLALAACLGAAHASAQDASFFDLSGVLVDCGGRAYLDSRDSGHLIGIPDTMGFTIGSQVHLIGLGGSHYDPNCINGNEMVSHYVLAATSPIQYFCGCDTGAPCAGALSSAELGCVNHTGSGALLACDGVPAISTHSLVPLTLRAWNLSPGQLALPVMSSSQRSVAFGNGRLCVGGMSSGIYRFPAQNSTPTAGMIYVDVIPASQSFPPAGRITAGSTWNFQVLYRDPGGPCGAELNATNAAQVSFAP